VKSLFKELKKNFFVFPENKADLVQFMSAALISQIPADKEVLPSGWFVDEQD
jgi:hypothetical protein